MLYFYVFFKILIKLEKKNSRLVHSLDKTSFSVLALQEELPVAKPVLAMGLSTNPPPHRSASRHLG